MEYKFNIRGVPKVIEEVNETMNGFGFEGKAIKLKEKPIVFSGTLTGKSVEKLNGKDLKKIKEMILKESSKTLKNIYSEIEVELIAVL